MIEWRPIADFEDRYLISDSGQVQSLIGRGRILRTQTLPSGYQQVYLRRAGRAYTRYIHRLVAEAFLGPCPLGQEVRHGSNGIADNSATNLCYGTRKENHADKIRDGTQPWGSKVYCAKLTEIVIPEIRSRAMLGETHQFLADEYGVARRTISDVVRHHTWKHV